jgi:hypothetical protein
MQLFRGAWCAWWARINCCFQVTHGCVAADWSGTGNDKTTPAVCRAAGIIRPPYYWQRKEYGCLSVQQEGTGAGECQANRLVVKSTRTSRFFVSSTQTELKAKMHITRRRSARLWRRNICDK